jgi:hypothetical protein
MSMYSEPERQCKTVLYWYETQRFFPWHNYVLWRKIFAHEAFVIRRLYRQLQDTYQGPKDYHEKGMRRNVVWNTCIYRNWVSSLEHFAARFWELPVSLYPFITNIRPESFIASSCVGRYNLHCLLLLRKCLQSFSCLIVEFSYNTLHKSKEKVSKKNYVPYNTPSKRPTKFYIQ